MTIMKRNTDSGIRYDVRVRDSTGRQVSKTFTHKKAAQDFEARHKVARAEGVWSDSLGGRITFNAWVTSLLPLWRTRLKPSSLARDETYLRVHLLPEFGDTPLAKILPLAVKRFLADKATTHRPATVHKMAQILSKILREAVDDGRITRNPVVGIALPRIEVKEMKVLDPNQVEHLVRHLDTRYRTAVHLFAYSGLRARELFALRGRDVDPLGGHVTVREALTEVRGKLHFASPKSKAALRRVPLPRTIADEVGQHMLDLGAGPDDLVFPSPHGMPVRLAKWRQRYWYPATTAADLPGLRIHDLRHTAVTLWIAADASAKEIAVRAGHRSVATILDRYGHLLPSRETEITENLDRMARDAAANWN